METIFAADVPAELKTYSSSFMKDDGILKFMDTLFGLRGLKDSAMSNWAGEHGRRGMCKRSIQAHRTRLQGAGRSRTPISFRVNSKRVMGVEMVEVVP